MPIVQQAEARDERSFAGVEVVRLRFLHRAADVRVADEEVHGCAEEVREADERSDVRLHIVIFILVDGLLRHPDGFPQLCLGNVEPRAQQP